MNKRFTIENVPVDLVEVLGNFIRKTAYTQLSAIRLVGLGISEDEGGNDMILSTNPVGNTTTTVLDVVTKIIDCPLKDGVLSMGNNYDAKDTHVSVKQVKFTNLKTALDEFIDTSNLRDDLLITDSVHVVKLAFMRIDKDMNGLSLQAFMPEGITPIPCSVLKEFKLDYSNKDSKVLSFEISEELADQLIEVLNNFKQLEITNN